MESCAAAASTGSHAAQGYHTPYASSIAALIDNTFLCAETPSLLISGQAATHPGAPIYVNLMQKTAKMATKSGFPDSLSNFRKFALAPFQESFDTGVQCLLDLAVEEKGAVSPVALEL